MTMLHVTPRYSTAMPTIRRGAAVLLAHFGRLINCWIAAAIARHERQAALWTLHRLSDRELKDVGLHRCEIDTVVAEAAKSKQRFEAALCAPSGRAGALPRAKNYAAVES